VLACLYWAVPGLSENLLAAEPSLQVVRDGDRFRVIWSPTASTTNTTSDRISELRNRSKDLSSRARRSLSDRTTRTRGCTSGCTPNPSDSSGGAGQRAVSSNPSSANPNPTASSCDGSRYQAEREFLNLINRARSVPRQCGSESFRAAPPVTWDTRLATAAGGHSRDMATYDFLSHTGSDGLNVAIRAQSAGYQWRAIGENIAVGYTSPDAVLGAWLRSPGHCKNIMSSNYTEIGAASARNGSALYGNCARWWTLVVARPR